MLSLLRAAALCLWLPAAAASVPAAPVEVDDGLKSIDLASRLEVLEDPSGKLDFDAATASPDFQPVPEKGPNFGFSHSAWWVRLTLANREAHDRELVLRQGYPLIDYVDLWSPQQDGSWKHTATGDLRNFDTREFSHRDFLFSVQLPASEQRTYYLRFASSGPIDIALTLYEPTTLLGSISEEQLAYGAYFGGFLVLVLYNFFMFLVVRDRAFFYYLLYAISYGLYFSVFNGLSFQFLWPQQPVWGNMSLLVLLSLSLIFGMQFTRKFLDTRLNSSRQDRFAVILQALAVVALLLSFFLPYSILILPLALLTVVVTATIMSMGITCLIRGYRPARYFMIAWGLLLLGVLVYMLKTFGVLPHSMLTQNGFQVGSLSEMVLLSLALASRVNEMQRQSRTDALTKLFNRRFFDERVAFEFERAQRVHSPLALLVADIDHFKEFNDRHGHARGDEVLKAVAKQLLDGVRSQDVVCRYGGEEFALILPGTSEGQAMHIAEQLREGVQASRPQGDRRITISVGVAGTDNAGVANASDLFHAADKALYQAKAQGRNCVIRAAG